MLCFPLGSVLYWPINTVRFSYFCFWSTWVQFLSFVCFLSCVTDYNWRLSKIFKLFFFIQSAWDARPRGQETHHRLWWWGRMSWIWLIQNLGTINLLMFQLWKLMVKAYFSYSLFFLGNVRCVGSKVRLASINQ
jgi:hypothetical protein